MPYEIFLALRYLWTRRGRRGAAQATALAAAVGIACGVAALTLALALANGFRDELQDKILRGTAHLTVVNADGGGAQPLAEWRGAAERVRRVRGVVDASATAYEGALLSGPAGAAHTVLRGVDGGSTRIIEEVRRTLVAGACEELFRDERAANGQRGERAEVEKGEGDERAPVNNAEGASDAQRRAIPVIVGTELAERTGLRRVGEEGWILTAERRGDAPQGFAPSARRVRVAGLFRSGLYDYDSSWSYVSLENISDFGGANGRAISVAVEDIYETRDVASRAREALGARWTTVDWREANRPLFAALELERRTVALIITLIMIVAALNITATLVLVVVERRSDIAILGALGARPRSVMTVFIIEGALVGAVGALAGVALGLFGCFLGNRFEIVQLPPDVYSLSAVSFHPHAPDVVLTALAAFAVSLLATIYPARAAARLRPAEALRYE